MSARRVPASRPRVALDTNVALSALIFRSAGATRLREAWTRGAFDPIVSTATAGELIRVLAYPKFKLSRADQEELLADYLPYTTTVTIPVPPPDTPDCRDPHDLPFLHLAIAGKADCIVSGDNDLLSLDPQRGFRILTLTQFVELIDLV